MKNRRLRAKYNTINIDKSSIFNIVIDKKIIETDTSYKSQQTKRNIIDDDIEDVQPFAVQPFAVPSNPNFEQMLPIKTNTINLSQLNLTNKNLTRPTFVTKLNFQNISIENNSNIKNPIEISENLQNTESTIKTLNLQNTESTIKALNSIKEIIAAIPNGSLGQNNINELLQLLSQKTSKISKLNFKLNQPIEENFGINQIEQPIEEINSNLNQMEHRIEKQLFKSESNQIQLNNNIPPKQIKNKEEAIQYLKQLYFDDKLIPTIVRPEARKNYYLKIKGVQRNQIDQVLSSAKETTIAEIKPNEFVVKVIFNKKIRVGKKLKINSSVFEILRKVTKCVWVKPFQNVIEGNSNNFKQEEIQHQYSIGYLLKDELNNCAGLLKREVDKLVEMNVYFNEDVVTFIFFNELLKLAFVESKIKVIGTNVKMSETINNIFLNFKCDVLFRAEEKMYIVECKFRLDRVNQGIEALRCIAYKQYTERVINYYRAKEGEAEKVIGLKRVVEIGIALEKNYIITITKHERKIADIDFEFYKTLEFAQKMKGNAKRYSGLCEDL